MKNNEKYKYWKAGNMIGSIDGGYDHLQQSPGQPIYKVSRFLSGCFDNMSNILKLILFIYLKTWKTYF